MNPSKTLLLSIITATSLAGCATGAKTCSADWYQTGQRDGRLGATPQADYYAARCAGAVDRARYQSGWEDGYAQRPVPLW